MTLLIDRPAVFHEGGTRELLLIWQNRRTSRFSKVGILSVSDAGFVFRYAEDARADPDFFPLDEFPRLDGEYASSSIPPFFANRIMSSARDSYDAYLGWLGLAQGSPELPLEILVRTGAGRATDTFHVVEMPSRGARIFISRFFVSGVRHQPRTPELLAVMSDGDPLILEPEPDNTKNPDAYRVLRRRGEPIGRIPDWLCGEIAELAGSGWRLDAVAEKVSPDAPPHIQVLCRITARLGA